MGCDSVGVLMEMEIELKGIRNRMYWNRSYHVLYLTNIYGTNEFLGLTLMKSTETTLTHIHARYYRSTHVLYYIRTSKTLPTTHFTSFGFLHFPSSTPYLFSNCFIFVKDIWIFSFWHAITNNDDGRKGE